MSNVDQLKVFLSMFLVHLPILIVSLVAVGVILAKWRQASRGAAWGLAGFGLILLLSLVMPVVQSMIQRWVIGSGMHAARGWAFSVMGVVTTLLYAVADVCLLVAIFAGRPAPPAPPQVQWSAKQGARGERGPSDRQTVGPSDRGPGDSGR